MSDRSKKLSNMASRLARSRATIHGSTERPRLNVTISNTHISVQIIDDESHKTLASATTVGKKISGTMTEKAMKIGQDIADLAKSKKISKVVFDRGAKKYHGRIKALADAARKNGLEF